MNAGRKNYGARRQILVLLMILLSLSACVSVPPHQEMSDARQAIALAAEAGAAEKSPRLFNLARSHLEGAKEKMESRSFNVARGYAVLAREKAIEALEEIKQQSD